MGLIMLDTLIIGAGGHGKVVCDILRAAGTHKPIGFVDADPKLAGQVVAGLPVLGSIHRLPHLARLYRHLAVIVAIGDNRTRVEYARTVQGYGLPLVTAIHPSAVVSPSARIGTNCVIAAGAIVCADATIEDSVIINTAATVDHECQIGAGVHLCPGVRLAGRVRIGTGAFVGMGSTVIQCLSLGEQSVIGAGAVVLRDVPDGATVVGVPARVVKTSSAAAA
jgi:UDP-perosamine 4-acetyltransferase